LHKHHRDIGVERRKEGGVYRFYPKGHGNGTKIAANDTIVVSVRLRRSDVEVLDVLVAAGRFTDRSEAVSWAASNTIASLPGDLKTAVDQVRKAASSI